MKIVAGSYAWIEHSIGGDKGRKVDEILVNAAEVYTSDIVLAEVARKYLREGVAPKIIGVRLEGIVAAFKTLFT